MRKLILVALFLMVISLTFAQTDVNGDVSGHWTFANSPYNVTGDITLQSNSTLVIDPGVEVMFAGHYKFDVNGLLLAIGNSTDHILFTATDHQTGWAGIKFLNIPIQDTTKVFYCDFEYGITNGSDSSGGAIYLKNADVYFNHVKVSNNQAMGYGGGIYIEESSPLLHNMEIFDNVATFDGGGIYCGFHSHPDFYRVAIAHNSTQWNGGGIAFFNNCDATLVNLTVSNNHADQDGQAISIVYETNITILSSIFWNNGYPEIYANTSSSVTATYSDIQYGTNQSYFGDGCLDVDPLFVNPADNNYALNGHSACINTGSPNQLYDDPDGTRTDMGAYYHAVSGIAGVVRINFAEDDNITTYADVTVIASTAGLDDFEAIPDENGVYYFLVPPGDYMITASLAGYYSAPVDPIPVHVEDEMLTYVIETIYFNPPQKGTVWGHVAIEGNGNVTSILIDIDGLTTNPYPIYIGDVLDHYEYSIEVPQGFHILRASLSGYTEYLIEDLIVPPNVLMREDIYLNIAHTPGTITGSVVLKGADGTGTGSGNVEDVLITDGIHTTSPDALGNFTLETYAGIQNVTASLEHYNFVTLPAIVLTGHTTTGVDFVLLNWDLVQGNQYAMTVFATMSYDGDFLLGETNNSVAAFGPGGITDCRGIATWIAGNHPYWCQDKFYYGLPGFWYLTLTSQMIGDINNPYNQTMTDQLTFKVYNSDTNEVLACHGSLGFFDGYNIATNVEAPSPIHTQEFPMIANWNWLSFNLRTTDNAISTIFSDLTSNDDIYQVKWENSVALYQNPSWFGELQYLEPNYGLKVNMHNAANFTFSGEKINSIIYHNLLHYDGSLAFNYNWVSYYPYEPLPINVALASLGDKIRSVKGQHKSAYLDNGNWIGDLTILEPESSYLIDLYIEDYDPIEDPAMLIYPTAYYYQDLIDKGITNEESENLAGWNLISGNSSNMIFMASINADSKFYEMGIFDDNNECRSIGKEEDGFWYFTVLGDNPENLSIRAFNKSTGENTTLAYTLSYEANNVLGTPDKPIAIKFDGENNPTNPVAKILKGNYPNPFNPQTQINFAIPSEGKVNLSVYNIKGQLVETLLDEKLNSGDHSQVWDASEYGSGVYFYKLTYNGKSEIKKCIMLK